MLYVSKNDFLKIFDNKNPPKTFQDFLKKAQVRNGSRIRPLKEYIQTNNIPIEKVKILYDNIIHKNEYLESFYDTSLKIPENGLKITDKPMKKNEMNNNVLVNYKNIIRNIFYIEILKETKSGIPNVPTYMDVLEDLYIRNIIEYKILTPSSLHYIENGRLGSVFSSFYFRASIMNPYLVYSLNHKLLKAKRVFTPTLGWGSYYFGFSESGIDEYVGTDVIHSVCNKTRDYADNYYKNIQTKIYCSPSEDLLKDKFFLRKYKNHFDVVFFSPPYYKLELYPGGDNQSTERYNTYEEWLAEYWEKTIMLCYHVLEKKGKLCYILSNYGSHTNLLDDMNSITKTLFTQKSSQPMFNKNVHVTEHRETNEMIMIFTKN
jgi:hypothetical protein